MERKKQSFRAFSLWIIAGFKRAPFETFLDSCVTRAKILENIRKDTTNLFRIGTESPNFFRLFVLRMRDSSKFATIPFDGTKLRAFVEKKVFSFALLNLIFSPSDWSIRVTLKIYEESLFSRSIIIDIS